MRIAVAGRRAADLPIVKTSAHRDARTCSLQTSSVRPVIAPVAALSAQASILIRSKRLGGFIAAQAAGPRGGQIAFAREFVRKSMAVHPSHIVLWERSDRRRRIADAQRKNLTHDLFGSA